MESRKPIETIVHHTNNGQFIGLIFDQTSVRECLSAHVHLMYQHLTFHKSTKKSQYAPANLAIAIGYPLEVVEKIMLTPYPLELDEKLKESIKMALVSLSKIMNDHNQIYSALTIPFEFERATPSIELMDAIKSW